MVDIHNHLLFGIDDGAKTIDESLQMLEKAQKLGFRAIALTPHYIKGSRYVSNNIEKQKKMNFLINEIKKKGIKIDLYLGNEIYFENDIHSLVLEKKVTTLNGTRYLLFELPMISEVNNLKEVVFSLRVKGYIPIIAHPERYAYYQKKPNNIIELIEQGCLFQCNIGSLFGIYGKEARKCVKTLLKHNLVHFMATDAHHFDGKDYTYFLQSKAILEKIAGKEYTKELLEINPSRVLENKDVLVRKAIRVKKKLFFF